MIDYNKYKTWAEEARQRYEKELAELEGQRNVYLPEALERMQQQAREKYNKDVAEIKSLAREAIERERKALREKRKEARAEKLAHMRKTLGDALTARIIQESLEGKDFEAMVRAYEDASDDFERLLVAHYGARLLADNMRRTQFTALVTKDDPIQAIDRELEDLRRLDGRLAELDPIGYKENIRAKYHI